MRNLRTFIILVFIFTLTCIVCYGQGKSKMLVIISEKGFQDQGCKDQISTFKTAGLEVTVASTLKGNCKGLFGALIESTLTLKEIKCSAYDAVSIEAGRNMWDSPDLARIVKEFNSSGKPIGAICLGPVVLAKNGLLKGKRGTVYRSSEAIQELEKNGATYVEYPVMRDGNIVTANSPKSADAYAETLIAMLK